MTRLRFTSLPQRGGRRPDVNVWAHLYASVTSLCDFCSRLIGVLLIISDSRDLRPILPTVLYV